MKARHGAAEGRRNEECDGDQTGNGGDISKYIRTLGSKSLGGVKPVDSVASCRLLPSSHSPNQGQMENSPRLEEREKTQRSLIPAGGSGGGMIRDNENVCNTASSSSVYSMAQGGANGSGNGTYRVAQACDRCRAKKTRCDGKRPQCSQCALVGFECKVSDKLSRRAFPRGYTETLEERVRELEAENRRLVALCDIKEQQIHLVSNYSSGKSDKAVVLAKKSDERMLQELSLASGGALQVSSTNLYLLNKTRDHPSQDDSERFPDGKQHAEADNVHLKASGHGGLIVNPVSTNLNDPTSVSFEQNEAPGLPAVKALTSMSTREQSTQLATLVALSVPRSTEEILFIPQLLARIREIYGFTSKQCLYSVSLLSSLKANLPEPQLMKGDTLDCLRHKNLWEIDDLQKFLVETLKFDIINETKNDTKSIDLSFSEIDEMVQLFFDNWSTHIPILNKNEFFSYYDKFKDDIKNQPLLFKNSNPKSATRSKMISYKIFACILVCLCQMGLLIKVKSGNLSNKSNYTNLISYYHRTITLMYSNPYFGVLTTSLQSLQFLSLSLFYFLNVGNVSAIYELRGRVVSMAQQLRLHRCPSAVLGGSGSTMKKREQGDRRVLFWGIYYLDVFSALQLGVPRLFKDFEIECALPVSDNDDRKVSLAGQMIRLEGCVSKFSLAVIRFAKVLGNILDSIFKRGMTESIVKEIALIHENALDNWRRGLPSELIFEIDVNGTINMDEFNRLKQNNAIVENMDVMILLVLYFLAKSMIHLPVVATTRLDLSEDYSHSDDATQLGISDFKGNAQEECGMKHRSSSSYVLLQQATNTMLNVLESLKSVYLPLPINVARTKARFALLSARGLLEYTKGGALFLDNKTLLLSIVKDIEDDRKLEIPGIISWHSLKLLDMTINLLLHPPSTNVEKLDKLLKRKLTHYSRLMGRPFIRSQSVSQTDVKRKFDCEDHSQDDIDRKNSNLTPVSSKGDTTPPPEKKIKKEYNESDINAIESEPTNSIDIISDSKQRLHQEELNNPVSTQNAIVEAFQLDPVLNNNLLSDIDLFSFFSNCNNRTEQNVNLSSEEQCSFEKGATTAELKNNQKFHDKVPSFSRDSNATDVVHGLFRVPSNTDFLNDEYYFPPNSQFNIPQYNIQNSMNANDVQSKHAQINRNNNNATAPNAGMSFSNVNLSSLFDHMHNDGIRNEAFNANIARGKKNDTNTSGYPFAVDASLGLAPLLAWTPDMTVQATSMTNHSSNVSDRTGVILDSAVQPEEYSSNHLNSSLKSGISMKKGQPHTRERTYAGSSLVEHQNVVPLVQDSAQSGITGAEEDSSNNEILTLSSRRRPRRRQIGYPTDNAPYEGQKNAISQSRDNYEDLFQWQNSK